MEGKRRRVAEEEEDMESLRVNVARLRDEKAELVRTVQNFESLAREEMHKIRAAWSERYEVLKVANTELRRKLVASQESQESLRRQLERYEHQRYSQLDTSQADRDRARQLEHDLALAKAKLLEYKKEILTWRSSAKDFANDEDRQAINPSELQLRLFALKNQSVNSNKQCVAMYETLATLKGTLKQRQEQLNQTIRDYNKLCIVHNNARSKNEKLIAENAMLRNQLAVLENHAKLDLPGREAEIEVMESCHSSTESVDEAPEDPLVLAQAQIEKLGDRLKELETQSFDLRSERDKLRIQLEGKDEEANHLVTEVQRLTVKLSESGIDGLDADEKLKAMNQQLVKQRDAAVRRADNLRMDHRSDVELLIKAVELALGWKLTPKILTDNDRPTYQLQLESLYTPEEDPGKLLLHAPISSITKELKNRKVQSHLLAQYGQTAAAEPPTDDPATFESGIFTVRLVGRLLNKWSQGTPSWRSLYSVRRRLPPILAVVCIDEMAGSMRLKGRNTPNDAQVQNHVLAAVNRSPRFGGSDSPALEEESLTASAYADTSGRPLEGSAASGEGGLATDLQPLASAGHQPVIDEQHIDHLPAEDQSDDLIDDLAT